MSLKEETVPYSSMSPQTQCHNFKDIMKDSKLSYPLPDIISILMVKLCKLSFVTVKRENKSFQMFMI